MGVCGAVKKYVTLAYPGEAGSVNNTGCTLSKQRRKLATMMNGGAMKTTLFLLLSGMILQVWGLPPPQTGIVLDQGLSSDDIEPSNCIKVRLVRSVEIVNEKILILRGTHGRYWLNKLRNQCHGLRDDMMLAVHRYGTQICANDRFEAQERTSVSPFTISCRWGQFEPLVIEQVAVIKRGLGNS